MILSRLYLYLTTNPKWKSIYATIFTGAWSFSDVLIGIAEVFKYSGMFIGGLVAVLSGIAWLRDNVTLNKKYPFLNIKKQK